jgi:hypothetical protein
MGLRSLNFSKVDDVRWESEAFTPEESSMMVQVVFAGKPGAAVLEMSIDGVHSVVAGKIAGPDSSRCVIRPVCGIVLGTEFKVVCMAEPEGILVLIDN